jgi:hypothetical protein
MLCTVVFAVQEEVTALPWQLQAAVNHMSSSKDQHSQQQPGVAKAAGGGRRDRVESAGSSSKDKDWAGKGAHVRGKVKGRKGDSNPFGLLG